MSVIIRLQNLPWTANARDIRNFFTGLSIPEGGVHIIGGEMGDAFIAFSTDEDARCAMLKDREKLMEIQVRLLLSSRAEMQKVIETARQVSVAAAAATAAATVAVVPSAAASVAAVAMPPVPQPPMIGRFLGQLQQQQQQQSVAAVVPPSFLSYQQQAGITLADVAGVKAERLSPTHFSTNRGRHSRSHSDSHSNSSDDSDNSRDLTRDHSRDRIRDRDTRDRVTRKRRADLRNDSSERELKMQPWATVAPATTATVAGVQQQLLTLPALQGYTTNSYNLSQTAAVQQQQLTATTPQQQQQLSPQQQQLGKPEAPIAFANVNPYEQMYPQLFQQQQQLLLQQQTAKTAGNSPNINLPATVAGDAAANANNLSAIAETCYIKISGMCPTTSYSDLRKYFAGLYIPHNGIKIINDNSGTRTGVAYIEFSRVSSAQKALARHNTMFRQRQLQIVPISDEEFEQAEERAPRGGGAATATATAAIAAATLPAISVLYVEDLPQLTTEQDIMKMFSATCTIVDILLTASPNNRREFVAFVLFAREKEARSALEDTARHFIGFRKLRVRASSPAEMHNAKEKMRRANEQLQKEEQMQKEEQEREQQLNQQQEQLLALQAKFSNDPRRRNNASEGQGQQQQQQQSHNLQAFGNAGNAGNLPFAFHPNNNNNNGMHMHNNNNNNQNNMAAFAMQMLNNNNNNNNNNFSRRPEDNFVRVHNCEYATRIHDLGELFHSENLRIEHIEMLYNERNQSAGEFIIEFVDAHNAKMAVREFHNRRFRGRGLRLTPITPQEIADRMQKIFMDYVPGGNGPRHAEQQAAQPTQQQQQPSQQQQQQQQQSRRRGPSRFDDAASQQQQQPPLDSADNSKQQQQQQHFNPFAMRNPVDLNLNEVATSPNSAAAANVNGGNANGVAPSGDNDGIPDKFNRPGCVVAMRNVPFKADLKDILRFFNDYKLSPDDIIRRFNDEGKPTGDARVAFESSSEARSAFESRRRKQIFNRTVYLDII